MTEIFAQAGTIPYRIVEDVLEVLLISTSSGKNLTIPKELINPSFSAIETALNEAYEEARIEGRSRHGHDCSARLHQFAPKLQQAAINKDNKSYGPTSVSYKRQRKLICPLTSATNPS